MAKDAPAIGLPSQMICPTFPAPIFRPLSTRLDGHCHASQPLSKQRRVDDVPQPTKVPLLDMINPLLNLFQAHALAT